MENIEGGGGRGRTQVGRQGWRNNDLYYKPKLNLLVESITKTVIYLMFDKCPPSKTENKEAFLSSNFAML